MYLNQLPPDKEAAVLGIGVGIGQHTKFLAQKCKHIEILEVIPSLVFMAEK